MWKRVENVVRGATQSMYTHRYVCLHRLCRPKTMMFFHPCVYPLALLGTCWFLPNIPQLAALCEEDKKFYVAVSSNKPETSCVCRQSDEPSEVLKHHNPNNIVLFQKEDFTHAFLTTGRTRLSKKAASQGMATLFDGTIWYQGTRPKQSVLSFSSSDQ